MENIKEWFRNHEVLGAIGTEYEWINYYLCINYNGAI